MDDEKRLELIHLSAKKFYSLKKEFETFDTYWKDEVQELHQKGSRPFDNYWTAGNRTHYRISTSLLTINVTILAQI